MRKPSFIPLPALWRVVLAALVATVLSACSAGSLLTDSGYTSPAEPKGKTVPPVAFQQISGIPPGKLADLKAALSSAGGQHDIGFVEGNFQSGVFSLGGSIRALPESAGVRLVYEWQFRDADGVLVDTIDGEDNAGVYSGADPWGAVTSDVVDRIARRTAEAMARKLAAMGYATRLTGLTMPPAEFFAQAGPAAGRQIDFETVHGPGLAALGTTMLASGDQVVDHEDIAPGVASVAPIPGEGVMPDVAVSDAGLAATPPASDDTGTPAAAPEGETASARAVPATARPGQQTVRAVAVLPVKGSPGNGDEELTAAMRRTLSSAGWPVVSKPQADAITIEGRVKMSAQATGTDRVALRWLVRSPDGKVLGDVNQVNDVPKGALASGWGSAATSVAEAAASGIFDLVKRYQ